MESKAWMESIFICFRSESIREKVLYIIPSAADQMTSCAIVLSCLLPLSTLTPVINLSVFPSGRLVRLAYQPPANSTFLSEQTSHQQPARTSQQYSSLRTNQHHPSATSQVPFVKINK
jgi:hypothetical protein